MTQEIDDARIYSRVNEALVEINDFLEMDGQVLIKFLIEHEILDHSQVKSIFDSMIDVFSWLTDRLTEFDSQFATVDAAIALLEVIADVVEYLVQGIQELAGQMPDTDILQSLRSIIDKIPSDMDLSKVTDVISFLPNPLEVQTLKKTLASLIGSANMDGWTGESLQGALPFLSLELENIQPEFNIKI